MNTGRGTQLLLKNYFIIILLIFLITASVGSTPFHNAPLLPPRVEPEIYAAPSSAAASSSSVPHSTSDTTILREDFEDNRIPPSGWSHQQTNNNYTWTISSQSPHGGFYCAQVLYDPQLRQQDEWLITPSLDFTGYTQGIFLSFYWKTSYYWAVEQDTFDFNVQISLDGGSSWETVWNEDTLDVFTSWIWYETSFHTPINLTAYAGNPQILIGFQYIGSNGSQFNLDDIHLVANLRHDAALTSIITPTGSLQAHKTGLHPQVVVENQGSVTTTIPVQINITKTDYSIATTRTLFEEDNASYMHFLGPPPTSGTSGWVEQWHWGSPQYSDGPKAAHSQNHCWGTNLSGVLHPYGNMVLQSPPVNLSTVPSENLHLRFSHWYNFYPAREGGNVKISTDNGSNWSILGSYEHPYPYKNVYQNYGINFEPCYSGSTDNQWTTAVFNLSAYANETILLRFHCGSSTSRYSGKRAGWYIDDVAIAFQKPIIEYTETQTVTLPPETSEIMTFPVWKPADWSIAFDETLSYEITAQTILLSDENSDNNKQTQPFLLTYPFYNDMGIQTILHPRDTQKAARITPEVAVSNYGQLNQTDIPVHLTITKAEERRYYLQESFETGLPDHWTIQDGGNSTHTWDDSNPTQRPGQGGCEGIFMLVDSHQASAPPPPFPPQYHLNESLITPAINCSTAHSLHLSFDQYYRHYLTDTASVSISNDSGTTWTTIITYNTSQIGPTHLNLTEYAAGHNDIRIKWTYDDKGTWAYYWMIDNVHLYSVLSSGNQEYNQTLHTTLTADTTTTLLFPTWTPTDILKHNISIIYHLTATTDLTTTGIQDKNTANDQIITQTILLFIKDLGILPPRTLIFSESFEQPWTADSDGDLAPPNWENHITDHTTTEQNKLPHHWGQYETIPWNPPAIPPDGDRQAMVQWSYNPQDEWLITPPLDLGNIEQAQLTFWWYGHTGSPHNDHYLVKASPTADIQKTSFTKTLWDATQLIEQNNHYQTPYQLNLSAFDGTHIRLAWHNDDPTAGDGLWYSTALDHITLTGEHRQTYNTFGQKTIQATIKNYGSWYQNATITATIHNTTSEKQIYSSSRLIQNISANTTQQILFDPWTVTSTGFYTLSIHLLLPNDDQPNNNHWKKTIIVDTTPPATTHKIQGESGQNNWYISPPTLSFDATDDLSGIANTYYQINNQPWKFYTDPVTITTNGIHTISYYSEDYANNTETTHQFSIAIDTELPTITLTKERLALTELLITAQVTDNISGIDRVEFSTTQQTEPYVDTEEPYQWTWQGIGKQQIIAVVYDAAGNQAENEISTPVASPSAVQPIDSTIPAAQTTQPHTSTTTTIGRKNL